MVELSNGVGLVQMTASADELSDVKTVFSMTELGTSQAETTVASVSGSHEHMSDEARTSRRKQSKTLKVTEEKPTSKFLDEDLLEYTPIQTIKEEGVASNRDVEPANIMHCQSSCGTTEAMATKDISRADAVDSLPSSQVPRGKKRKEKSVRVNMLIRCTACNCQIGLTAASGAFEHAVLKVLVCRKCHEWYGLEEIVRGADGKDEHCRWCGEGGDLICCDSCHNAFCKVCIRRNLGRKALMDLLNADDAAKWECYVCNSEPIRQLVEQCTLVMEAAKKRKNQAKHGKERMDMRCHQTKAVQQKASRSQATKLSAVTHPHATAAVVLTPPNRSFIVQRKDLLSSREFVAKSLSSSPPISAGPSHQRILPIPSPFPNAQLTSVNRETMGSSHTEASRDQSWKCMTVLGSMGQLKMIDDLLLASGSMLNFLTQLSEELSFTSRAYSSLESMPHMAEHRRNIASRLWSGHRNYLQKFQHFMHKGQWTPFIDSERQQQSDDAFRRVTPNPGSDYACPVGVLPGNRYRSVVGEIMLSRDRNPVLLDRVRTTTNCSVLPTCSKPKSVGVSKMRKNVVAKGKRPDGSVRRGRPRKQLYAANGS